MYKFITVNNEYGTYHLNVNNIGMITKQNGVGEGSIISFLSDKSNLIVQQSPEKILELINNN